MSAAKQKAGRISFSDLPALIDALISGFSGKLPLSELPAGEYAAMHYPKFPAIMHFTVRQYAAPGYGNVFTMYTRAMGGLMQLATIVFTPNTGTDVPLLLIDVMAMGKKRAAFVEYYDCTVAGADCPALSAVAARYAAIPDYPEKPAWYIGERTPYSLIKGGTDDAELSSMLRDSVAAYAAMCAAQAAAHPENRTELSKFINRMVAEGNPSSATMERVLGKAGAEQFFRTAVMPAVYTDTNTAETV